MSDFISKFKQSVYYKQLFETDQEILLIYLGGSRCFNVTNEFSDYDINITTLNGGFKNMHDEYYLTYNGVKVHWFYRSLRYFFESPCTDLWTYSGILTLKGISDDLIIYKNPNPYYNSILEQLIGISTDLLVPISYNIFEYNRSYLENILNSGDVLIRYYDKKAIYFLVLASYFILKEPLDTELLKVLNLYRRTKSIPDPYKATILERLKYCDNYIKQFPLDTTKVIENLYEQFKANALIEGSD